MPARSQVCEGSDSVQLTYALHGPVRWGSKMLEDVHVGLELPLEGGSYLLPGVCGFPCSSCFGTMVA